MAKGPGQGWEETDPWGAGGLSSLHLCKASWEACGHSVQVGWAGRAQAELPSFLPLLLPLSPPPPGILHLQAPYLCSGAQRACGDVRGGLEVTAGEQALAAHAARATLLG